LLGLIPFSRQGVVQVSLQMAVMFLSTITLLLLSAHATPTAVVRREQRQTQASLSSSGAVLAEARAHAHDQVPEEMTKIDDQIVDQQNDKALDDVGGEDSEQTAVDFCNFDFPLGVEKSNNCSDSRHRRILDMGECRQAAVEAGAGINKDFEVEYDWYNKHPEGCFKEKCSKNVSAEETCYFYNPAPVSPSDIQEGSPVCKRPKLLIGTNDTNPDAAPTNSSNSTSNCPKDYEAVRIEAKCKEFGACMGHCIGEQFRINIQNASLYNQYPKYCFIHADDNCVYFNEPREGMPDPTAPVGTPICNVSAITHFPAQQAF